MSTIEARSNATGTMSCSIVEHTNQAEEWAHSVWKRRNSTGSAYQSVTTIFSGQGQQKLLMLTSLLEQSPWFKAAIECERQQNMTEIVLHVEAIATANLVVYFKWLLQEELPEVYGLHDGNDDEWQQLFELWVMADFLMDNTFQCCMIDVIIDKHKKVVSTTGAYLPSTRQIEYVWAATADSCGLQRLILDMYTLCNLDDLSAVADSFPPTFTTTLLKHVWRYGFEDQPLREPPEYYNPVLDIETQE